MWRTSGVRTCRHAEKWACIDTPRLRTQKDKSVGCGSVTQCAQATTAPRPPPARPGERRTPSGAPGTTAALARERAETRKMPNIKSKIAQHSSSAHSAGSSARVRVRGREEMRGSLPPAPPLPHHFPGTRTAALRPEAVLTQCSNQTSKVVSRGPYTPRSP